MFEANVMEVLKYFLFRKQVLISQLHCFILYSYMHEDENTFLRKEWLYIYFQENNHIFKVSLVYKKYRIIVANCKTLLNLKKWLFVMAYFVNIASFDIWSSLDILTHVLKFKSSHLLYVIYQCCFKEGESIKEKKTSLFNFMSNCQGKLQKIYDVLSFKCTV